MIDTVFFDLDGTLLPMDQDEFLNDYMGRLAKKLAPQGYDPKHLIAAVWAGTSAMIQNDGAKTNEEVFWDDFCTIFGPDSRKDLPLFEEFYATDFALVQTSCGFDPAAAEVAALLKEKGVTMVLATNPLFPAVATRQRIRWAGLDIADFADVTTYENSSYCKPNPAYYRELLRALGKDPARCLMVGNDVGDDMLPAWEVGMQTFLLTDCLINKTEHSIDEFNHGGFDELKAFLLDNL